MKNKVTKITKMEKQDSYGNTSFIVEFENGDKGFYTSKNENQNKFVPGQEAEYNIEEKQGKNSTYFKVTAPQAAFTPGGGNRPEPKTQMIGFAMSYTKDLVVAGKIGIEDLDFKFQEIYTLMISKL